MAINLEQKVQENINQIQELKQNLTTIATLVDRFDVAIDKLTDVSNCVDKMLAVHETRLSNQENQTEIVHARLSDYKKELMDEIKDMREESEKQHKEIADRITKLEKGKWLVVGAASAVGFIIAQIPWIQKIF